MESCLDKADRRDQVQADELKGAHSVEFSTSPDAQHSSIEEREHLRVYLRVRPFTSAETNSGESQDCVTIEFPDTVLLKPPSLTLSGRLSSDKPLPQTGQRFQFSQVYGPETTQKELFAGTVKDLVKDVLEGGNSLVFTYGITNAGKTFTFLGPDCDAGILPRSLDSIFSSIDEKVFPGMSIKPHRCREFVGLTREQEAEEASFKRNLFRQLKESEKSNVSLLNSTNRTFFEGSSMLWTTAAAEDKIPLELEANTKFSVWVSFCEIYNENIHDLLEVAPCGAPRRAALRLSQDVKGNAFVKDLRWVQVSSAEEAYMVMKLGKKNQSFSSTRLNHLSSRSHSIFSIRILRIEDMGTPRVQSVSELCLCDLAGSERCAKTQNQGERLKEAGNINTSLLILGKCISALRHNQQAKLLQHVPFRESKLTHYLQSFFCGRGKACMIVNINQCASVYDETLGVLKFSAVAQKVVVLSSKPLPFMPQRSAGGVSFISNTERSSVRGFESSLGDVQEDEDECEGEQSLMEDVMNQTEAEEDGEKICICKKTQQRQVALLKQLQVQLKKARAESLLVESRVREEISGEFSELFSEMQKDYSERLARERDILEERAERRLEIFKNLINKMAAAGPSGDTEAVDKFLDSCSSELAEIKNSTEAARLSLDPGRAGPNEQHEKAQELQECSAGEDEEKRTLLFELQKKSAEVAQLEKQVGELQRMAELVKEKSSREKQQLQEAFLALEKEERAREDTLAALECRTLEKEEAIAALGELKQSKEKMLEFIEEARKDKEKAAAALEAERGAKEEALAALSKEKLSREELLSSLQAERKEMSKLAEERGQQQDEGDALRQEVKELTEKLEAAEHQVTSSSERAEQAFVQLHAVHTQLDQQAKEIQEKGSQVQTLTQEVERLKQDLQTSTVSCSGVDDKLQEEMSALQKNEHREALDVERELAEVKRQLALKQLMMDQQMEQFTEKLNQKEAASKQEAEDLKKKLREQEDASQPALDELRSQLERQEHAFKQEVEELRGKLQQQTEASERQVEQLNEKLREQEATLLQQLEELKHRLTEQKETSSKLVHALQQKLSEHERTVERLRAELQEAGSHSEAEEDLKRLNSELQVEVTSLREKVSGLEKTKESSCKAEEKLAELQKMLLEKEAQVTALQKSLREAQDRRDEEECQAVQEARRREAERRRELLAVAHEAIAQKDAELEKRGEEISRLKENVQQASEKVRSLSLDLQRKEEETSDLREKLADYKKQVQQVQKEISAMREQEKGLKQKLADVEKVKKQLQTDLTSRDRTIQQLRAERPSNTKSDQTLQLYQQACKELEAKERVMEDMRLALSEQEDTQEQMERVLEEKLNLVQELYSEVEKLKEELLQQNGGNSACRHVSGSQSDDLKLAQEEAAQAQESLKVSAEKHRAERRKWLEEKLSLIGQAKEAEDKRNQEMRKFAEDRERCTRLQSQLESQLAEKEQTMDKWRTERDVLVAALEVQLQKLLSSQAEKDALIQQLQHSDEQPPQEGGDGVPGVEELQAALSEREAEILRLRERLEASTSSRENSSAQQAENKPESETTVRTSGRRDTRVSISSQGSSSCPTVLDSSEISTENGRTSRFPRPELEISFSPLQPNRVALRRQGEEGTVTVKLTRSSRKRKSGEMEKEGMEAENRRNTRTKLTPKLTPHQEESSSPGGHHESQISVHSKKEGTLQKIGDFLQSSPTLLSTKAKKMMSLVSGRAAADSAASSSSLRAKKNKRKLYRPQISSPIDMPSHPIISREPEERESDHQIIKRRLRSRVAK